MRYRVMRYRAYLLADFGPNSLLGRTWRQWDVEAESMDQASDIVGEIVNASRRLGSPIVTWWVEQQPSSPERT